MTKKRRLNFSIGVFVLCLNLKTKFDMKKTVVLGATPNPERYAYLATQRLLKFGHEVLPVGIKKGKIEGITIENGTPQYLGVDTVTLYLNSVNQRHYYDYILSLKPKRIVFNPGTENLELAALAKKEDIEVVVACTLVMLSIGDY
jgi:uncharacterized protein